MGVLLLGLGGVASSGGGAFASAVPGTSAVVVLRTVDLRAPVSAARSRPAGTVASPERAAGPWLPTGTGMWLHRWRDSEGGQAGQVVRRAAGAGLSVLYVQTGSSVDGWIGTPVLSQLLPATRGTGLNVVAWDFPNLQDPIGDARRMARAALFGRPGTPRVTAVAPDVETRSEGTQLSGRAIDVYYRTLRKALPAGVGILATVPWPSQYRVNSYPYARTARLVDAFAPMAYWYNNSPSHVTSASMTFLHRYGKPVIPVGQGYDGRLDAPYLAADPHPDRSVQAFVDAARTHGARGVSLWSWDTTGERQWAVLAWARTAFGLTGRRAGVAAVSGVGRTVVR